MSDDDDQQAENSAGTTLRTYWAACLSCDWRGDDCPNNKAAAKKDAAAHKKDNPGHTTKIRSLGEVAGEAETEEDD